MQKSQGFSKKYAVFIYFIGFISCFTPTLLIWLITRDWFFLIIASVCALFSGFIVLVFYYAISKSNTVASSQRINLDELRVEELIKNCYNFSRKYFPASTKYSQAYKSLQLLKKMTNIQSAMILYRHMLTMDINFDYFFYEYEHIYKRNLHKDFESVLRTFAEQNGFDFDKLIIQFFLEIEMNDILRGSQEIPAEFYFCKAERVILIKKPPKRIRGMVSQLQLDFKNEKILACPSCYSLAKEIFLQKWLQIRDYCPICQEKITINECYLVRKVRRLSREQKSSCKRIK